jgi:hypothetical protein
VTTSYATYSVSAAVDTASTKNLILFVWSDVTDTTAGDFLYIAESKLELGSTPTAFVYAGGTIQGELAACQRYYWRMGGEQVYQYLANGCAVSSTETRFVLPNPVTMRTTPTSLDYSTLAVYDVGGGAFYTATSVSLASASRSVSGVTLVVASGLTVQRPYIAVTNGSTNGFLGIIAEL